MIRRSVGEQIHAPAELLFQAIPFTTVFIGRDVITLFYFGPGVAGAAALHSPDTLDPQAGQINCKQVQQLACPGKNVATGEKKKLAAKSAERWNFTNWQEANKVNVQLQQLNWSKYAAEPNGG